VTIADDWADLLDGSVDNSLATVGAWHQLRLVDVQGACPATPLIQLARVGV
jgi:hypothetical protein